jgi:hypothetical protein
MRGSLGSPELFDAVGSLEVGEHQDVKQLGVFRVNDPSSCRRTQDESSTRRPRPALRLV